MCVKGWPCAQDENQRIEVEALIKGRGGLMALTNKSGASMSGRASMSARASMTSQRMSMMSGRVSTGGGGGARMSSGGALGAESGEQPAWKGKKWVQPAPSSKMLMQQIGQA